MYNIHICFCTGLYAESNGMIDNFMYDIKRDEYFGIGDDPEDFYTNTWYEGEPVWNTAMKQVERRSQDSGISFDCIGVAGI